MSRPKNIVIDEDTLEEVKAEIVAEFPYKLKLRSTGETITVVSEGVDAHGRKTLLTDTGCTYHAETAE